MKIEIYSPTIRRKEMDAVLTAMVEEKIGPGDRGRLLIQTAKEQVAFDYALALRSPAVALFLALKALTKPGQAVLLSALSPRYYLQVLRDLQLTPLYCDVSYDLPVMSRESIENAVSKKPGDLETGAVIIHHTLGFTPDTAAITELGIPVIEDISQSCGFWIKPVEKNDDEPAPDKTNKNSPNINSQPSIHGVFGIIGLEERDMLTSGGGALLFAMNKKDSSSLRGYAGIANEYCLPDINAALAVVQFKEIARNIERRRVIARIFQKACLSLFARTKHKRFTARARQEPADDNEYCNFAFSLILEAGLKDVIAYAKKKEIEVENAFENTIAGAGFDTGSACPVSNSLILRTVNFPLYPRLRSGDAERIARLIMTLP